MEVKEREILFIYDSNDIQQREALGYVKAFPGYVIKELDVQKDKMTQLHLADLARLLKVELKSLVKDDAEDSNVRELDEHDFLDYLVKNLSQLRTPITVYHNMAKYVSTQFELIKEDAVKSLHRPDSSRVEH